MAGALHRVVLRQLRGARRAAAWRLRRFAKPLPQGSRGAELLPADDSCPRLSLGRVRVDLRARRRGEAVARAGPAFRGRGHLPHHAAALPHLLRGAADARRDRCEANRVRRHPGPDPGRDRRIHVSAADRPLKIVLLLAACALPAPAQVAADCGAVRILSSDLRESEAMDYCRYAVAERAKVEAFWGATWTEPI